ncbi:MAG: extracellular solute-binding protein [Candidatus Izimaplasma sp.]|nr:extracellular solute-binding protein [Candidatus Izimaplasma bacterium]
MKKLLLVLLMTSLLVTLSACGGGSDPDPDPDPVVDENAAVISGVEEASLTVGDTFDQLDGVTAIDEVDGDISSSIVVTGTVDLGAAGNYTLTYTVTDSDGNTSTVTRLIIVLGLDGCAIFQELIDGVCVDIEPEIITIMHGAVYEIDPFHEAYSGTEQLEKQELQRLIEEQLNVVINYEEYPPSAGWGPSRINAIIQSSVSGDPLSDIYWITSDWVQQLADAEALADVTPYLNTHGSNIDDSYLEVGSYQGGNYGFEVGNVQIGHGLYYNADLVENLGVDNPTDLYLAGDWNWTEFEIWATDVQTQLSAQGDDMFALGGMLSYYAMNMIPLNGGSLINSVTARVSFAQKPALDTYDFLTNLYNKGLFELSPQYDAGSPEWMAGKVAMYPGSLWFVTADNRWGMLPFELGFVPYPVADDFTGEYISPVSGVALMSVASGMSQEREELVFQVWNELQLWKTDAELADAFELTLMTKFDEEIYIEAYLEIYDKTYLDLINAIGISAYSENGWNRNINGAIREGTSRTIVDQIKPIYEAALDDYIG